MFHQNYVVLLVILLLYGSKTDSQSQQMSNATSRCILPPHPDNGHWTLKNGNGEPGDTVFSNSILEFHCDEGHKLSNSPHVICFNNWSEKKMPFCEKLCPPLYSTSTTILKCSDKFGDPIECTQTTEGSFLTFECSPYYEIPLGHRRTIFCLDGVWNYPKPECQPVCGKKIETKPLVYGGRVHYTLEYPWIVAIYIKDESGFSNVCGGTIIHTHIVLTAAHCITNDYADPLSSDEIMVAAAKLYNKYGDPRDTDAQYVKISKVAVHPQYKGESRRFLGDIALLITKTSFKLGNLVKPACINDLSDIYLHPGLIGEAAGWGATENGLPAEELRSIEIPLKSDVLCSDNLPADWAAKYNLLDKICAGSPQTNISVCKGDSGSGLFFKNVEDGRYYIHGIVSLAPFSAGSPCNLVNSALYTKVSFYFNFIDAELSKINTCRLPPYPKNGKWVLESDKSKVPGDVVSLHAVLTFVCDPRYNLTTSNSTFDCKEAALHMPSCKATFVEITSSSSPAPFTPVPGVDEFLNTVDCGRKTNETNTTLPDNDIISHPEYPWFVLIYQERDLEGCGTLISRRVIMTIAALVWDKNTSAPLEARSFKIVLAKYYRFFGDPRDIDANYLDVSDVTVLDGYEGIADDFYANIGFLVTKKPVEFNKWIKPVCIKGVDKLQLLEGDVGIIYGYSNKYDAYTSEPYSLELAYKTLDTCFKDAPYSSNSSPDDLLCGGAPNRTAFLGDYGSGLWFINPEDGRYYLQAIVGTTHTIDGKPYPGANILFVSTKFHYDNIIRIVKRFG